MMKDTKILEQKELEILSDVVWGTIGAHSISAAAALASYVNAELGLLCHSLSAVYEAALRQCGAAHGKCVVTGEVSSPMNSLVAVCIGAKPVFAPVCEACGMVSPNGLKEMLAQTENVCCVTIDYLPEKAASYPLDQIAAICEEYKVPLLINAGGAFSASYNGKPLAAYAAAVLYSLEEGSEIYTGKGGFLATNDSAVHGGAFAYHNCGRGFGDGASINIGDIVGGDLRVTEWTAMAAEVILETKQFSSAVPARLEMMAGQPVFDSVYAKKMTE